MGDTDTTIDFIAIGVVALVIGYIVYEVSQAASSVNSSTGGWLAPIGALLAGILLF